MRIDQKRGRVGTADGDMLCVDNLIGGQHTPPLSGEYLDVVSPSDGTVLGRVALSGKQEVAAAVAAGEDAFTGWSAMTAKSRAAIMFRFHSLLEKHADELADLVVAENGKNKAEALASVAKGNETVEWACSMPQLMQGKVLQVSRGIECRDLREPLGVVACCVPFNFPIMVPMWTVPIALTAGNCVILKPSEKVPLTMHRVSQLLTEAGLPPGVFQIVNGGRAAAEALCDNQGIKALTFVGSSTVARSVAERCHASNKRVLALGGAENHLVALPDCDYESASHDIVASFAGCAGQRCMAASVLVLVGDTADLLDRVVAKAKALAPGTEAAIDTTRGLGRIGHKDILSGLGQVGPVISAASRDHIVECINKAVMVDGDELLVDGRDWAKREPGTWVGPTVILKRKKEPEEELFGPVLIVVKVNTWDEALEVENASPYGNAASLYTSSGAAADYFQTRFRAGMIAIAVLPLDWAHDELSESRLCKAGLIFITHLLDATTNIPELVLSTLSGVVSVHQGRGVNIGIPVPREPFAFGGLSGTASKYGDCDITSEGAMEFFTNRRKITTKWVLPGGASTAPGGGATKKDTASFVGQM